MASWTEPRDWTTGELVTASIMNTYVRDNQKAVKGMVKFSLPASAWVPADTNGPGGPLKEEYTNFAAYYLAFDDTTDEHAYATLRVPAGWQSRQATVEVGWKTSATPGSARWQVDYISIGDDDPWDAASFTSGGGVTSAAKAAGDDLVLATINFTPTTSAGDMLVLRLSRDADHGDDDLSGDAEFLHLFAEI